MTFAAIVRADSGPGYELKGAFAGASSAFLGYSAAIDGDTAIVGAIGEDTNKGAAHVYGRTSTTWAERQMLTLASGASGDQFGYVVAVSGDTALVGTTSTHDVQTFLSTGGVFALAAAIHDPDPALGPDDCFGCALALRKDIAVIGAPGKASGAGTVYVFARTGGVWQPVQTFF